MAIVVVVARHATTASISLRETPSASALGNRWSMPAPTSRAALVPVTVVDEPSAGGATLVSPSGYRVEGLELRDLAALLRALG